MDNREEGLMSLKRELRTFEETEAVLCKKCKTIEDDIEEIIQLKKDSKQLYDEIAAYWENTEIGMLVCDGRQEDDKSFRNELAALEEELAASRDEITAARDKQEELNRSISEERKRA